MSNGLRSFRMWKHARASLCASALIATTLLVFAFTADDFLKQIEFWGIDKSFAFVAEPQTKGVAERFNRTLKEQAIHGRIFRNLEEVRACVTEFRDRYNRHWRLENEVSAKADIGVADVKRSGRSQNLGFMSLLEARQAYAIHKAA